MYGNIKPERNRKPKALYKNDPSSFISLNIISLRLTGQPVVKTPPCYMHEIPSECQT